MLKLLSFFHRVSTVIFLKACAESQLLGRDTSAIPNFKFAGAFHRILKSIFWASIIVIRGPSMIGRKDCFMKTFSTNYTL